MKPGTLLVDLAIVFSVGTDAFPACGSNRPDYGQLFIVQKQWAAAVSHQSGRVGSCGGAAPAAMESEMPKTFYRSVLLTLCFVASNSLAQTVAPQAGTNTASLCVLQKKVAEGEHETARVSGLYGPGLDRTVLEDVGYPSESTWVELDLRSQENKKKLRKQLDRSRRA
jgi:hypothetical protein